ncbi:hypothetical protein H310_06830 [Aphanomyces invadans]|uniref:Serine hydrolase domain-containing protein n=1 Tax=Aphanomyces invadans TaxID=157072 RepID=A0A024U498_9STRA|nr:hypothetical protein H310_06830 [Aphanomyces invadans]ETW01246.1 hypothetical protein H310_06830 [Aphanomyces invadans]|eukprot:XP_008870244.1 hypothetical protein H310_06830 [Aphanomyces invadans]
MRHQVRGFRESFGPRAVFEYLNAPFTANGPTEDAIQDKFGSSEPFFEWFRDDPHAGQRGSDRYVGWEHSLAYLMRHLSSHIPYDIILGFSQGGMMATLLTAHYQAEQVPLPFKAIVCVGVVSWPLDGMPPSMESSTKLKVPAMIVLGEADTFFDTGKELVHVFDKATRRFFVHAEGHKFPSVKNHRALYDEIAADTSPRHGWRTNTAVISLQVAGFRQALGPTQAEFVSLNAPYPAKGPAHEDIRKFFGEKGPYYEWWDAVENPETRKTEYHGWERSVAFVLRQIDELGPFDVVLGFSQGAALTTLLTAHCQKEQGGFPYKAVVLVCGLVPIDGLPADMPDHLDIPSLHIVGEQDPMLLLGHQLHGMYSPTHRKLHVHPDGHRFPALPIHKPMYIDMARFLRQVCTPPQ